jgi:hypothetical protein
MSKRARRILINVPLFASAVPAALAIASTMHAKNIEEGTWQFWTLSISVLAFLIFFVMSPLLILDQIIERDEGLHDLTDDLADALDHLQSQTGWTGPDHDRASKVIGQFSFKEAGVPELLTRYHDWKEGTSEHERRSQETTEGVEDDA